MEGAVPHGLKTVEGPKVRKARQSHPTEAEVTSAQALSVSVSQNPCQAALSVLRSNSRVGPSLREERAGLLLLSPPTKGQLAMLFFIFYFDEPASPLPKTETVRSTKGIKMKG